MHTPPWTREKCGCGPHTSRNTATAPGRITPPAVPGSFCSIAAKSTRSNARCRPPGRRWSHWRSISPTVSPRWRSPWPPESHSTTNARRSRRASRGAKQSELLRLETAVRDSMARVAVAGVVLSRPVRILIASLLGALAVLGVLIAQPRPAAAATGDQIESFTISYDVAPSGVVKVQETIVYRFGSGSGRHGIERYFVTREPYDETQDALYKVENISVTSPDNVATQFSSRTDEAKGGREEQLRLRIGDPDRTISAPTATYVISYDLAGAMRTSGSYDEFYWDATGLDWTASIKQVAVSIAVPGGVQDTTCTYGPVNSTEQCPAKIVDGKAQYTRSNLAPGEGITISAKIKAGLVADN